MTTASLLDTLQRCSLNVGVDVGFAENIFQRLKMLRPALCFLAFAVALIGRSHSQVMAQGVDASQLIAKYNQRYKRFVDAFRASDQTDERLSLIRQASEDINALFARHVGEAVIGSVLPKLEDTKLLDLEPTFVSVIDNHPDQQTRALALLCFARYSGNNERRKTCEAALGYLKQAYGDVPYQSATFAAAVDDALYFYNHIAVGAQAPAMVGEDADGAVFRLADYRGKVVMLRFWGNWCPACRRMYGYERKLVQRFKNEPFALIGVNSDPRDECKRAQRESNLIWRSVWDGGTSNGPIAMVNRVHNWPTIIVIDAKGIIRYRSEGLDEQKLDKVLDRLVVKASGSDSSAVDANPLPSDALSQVGATAP